MVFGLLGVLIQVLAGCNPFLDRLTHIRSEWMAASAPMGRPRSTTPAFEPSETSDP
jgi:hypothetical protein